MQLAVVAAGFTPGEADQLRRSMAAWKRKGGLGHLRARLIDGMLAREAVRSNSPRRSTDRLKASAIMVFPNRMRPVLPCWSMCLPG